MTSREGEGLEIKFSHEWPIQSPIANDLIDNVYITEPSYEPQINEVLRASVLVNTMRY